MVKLTDTQLLLVSIGISLVLIITAFIIKDPGVRGNLVIISVFIVITPIFIKRYKHYREIKEMEERFPTFLRSLVESIRAGMPLHKSIISSKKIHYGSLSNEIKKMADQLSWGVNLDKVLDQFADRVKSSKRMFASIKILRESYLSGGNIVFTMDSLADTQFTLIDAEKEKTSILNQYVILMYAISFIFILIVIILNKLMIPIFGLSEGGEFGFVNPCNQCVGLECFVCSVYQNAAGLLFVVDSTTIAAYYTSLFFFMSLVEAISCGFVAGQISEGSFIAGMRHSLILAAIVFGIFSILIKIGLMGV